MKIKTLLTLTTKEQDQIEDFGHFIIEICDKIGRTNCNPNCLFREFCNYDNDVSYNFLEMLREEFDCHVNMNFED